MRIGGTAIKQVPVGWGIDEDGHNATDPVAILARGSLLPLGSLADLSAHKDYGLAMVVEILSAMIGGDAYGTGVTSLTTPAQSQPALVSHPFAAIDIGRFIELDRFRRRMDAWLAELRDSPKAPGFDRIYIPGEKEWASERDRRANGVALLPPVVRTLEALATRLGLAPLTAVETR